MAVEDEGLRVFQSVKIKIGKKDKTPPTPHLSSSMDGSALSSDDWSLERPGSGLA